jgi:hypothetical protein
MMDPETEANVPRNLTLFLKGLRDWLTVRHLPVAWVYAHEHSSTVGLHTHVILYLPGDLYPGVHCVSQRLSGLGQRLGGAAGRPAHAECHPRPWAAQGDPLVPA